MSEIRKFTENVNTHQNLSDQPTLSASDLKREWDKPANTIKEYINNTLIPDISEANKNVKNECEKKIEGIKTNVETNLDSKLKNFESNIDNKISGMDSKISSISSSVSGLIKTQTLSITVWCDAYSGRQGIMGTLSIPNGYIFVGFLMKNKPNYFVASVGVVSGSNTVQYTVHNIYNTALSGTVTAIAMFVKA